MYNPLSDGINQGNKKKINYLRYRDYGQKNPHETKSKKTITPRTNRFVNYRDSVFRISINQVFNSKFLLTWTKIQKTNINAKLKDFILNFAGKKFHSLSLKFLQLFL